MKRVTAAFILFFVLQIPAFADVYYTGPPTIYVRPDPGYQTGQILGNLLGALLHNANQRAEEERQRKLIQEERERLIDEIQVKIKGVSLGEVDFMKKMLENGRGVDMFRAIESFIYSHEMCTPIKDSSNGIASISYLKELDGGVKMFREYAVNTNTNQCRCLIRIAPFNIEEASVESYERPLSSVESIGKYLGTAISPQKTKNGGFEVLEVLRGGLSDLAGIKKGDILIKIDTYELKELDADRLAAYIALRYNQKQTIRATVLRGGEPLRVEIQL